MKKIVLLRQGKVSGTRKIPSLETSDEILIAAHGNSLRGIIKYLKNIPETKSYISIYRLPYRIYLSLTTI